MIEVTKAEKGDRWDCRWCGQPILDHSTYQAEEYQMGDDGHRWHYRCPPVAAEIEGATVLIGHHSRLRVNMFGLSGQLSLRYAVRKGDKLLVGDVGQPVTVVLSSRMAHWADELWAFEAWEPK